MIKYYNRFILIVCAVLIQQCNAVNSYYESPVKQEAASATEVAGQPELNDKSYTNINDSIKNVKLSEGGDKLQSDMNNKPTNGKNYEKKFSNVKNQSALNVGILSEEIHEPVNSSVVPRKGVDRNSVVPRKGVDIDRNHETADSDTHRTKINTNKTVQSAKDTLLEVSHPKTVKKKPVTSDKDSDDGDSLSFVESSSTGQDYMLTGVFIFVCIWASIFGTLFFYKRAGEFWDRRHYRRMDFLVEGMYND